MYCSSSVTYFLLIDHGRAVTCCTSCGYLKLDNKQTALFTTGQSKKTSAKGRGLKTISGMRPSFHPMRCFSHNFIVSRGWDILKQSIDSLWLVPLPDRSLQDSGAEGGGAVSQRHSPCSKLFGRTVGDAQEKGPVFDAGASASHDTPHS